MSRVRAVVAFVAVPAAVTLAGLVVAQASTSAHAARTPDPATSWAAGTVVLGDDDAGLAAFAVANARPGSSGSRCLVVTSSGTLPAEVRVYGAHPSGSRNLPAAVDLTITQGHGGSYGSCAGFVPLAGGAALFRGSLADFGAAHASYADGLGGWSPSGGGPEARTYRLDWAIARDAANETMGGTAGAELVFEAQND